MFRRMTKNLLADSLTVDLETEVKVESEVASEVFSSLVPPELLMEDKIFMAILMGTHHQKDRDSRDQMIWT